MKLPDPIKLPAFAPGRGVSSVENVKFVALSQKSEKNMARSTINFVLFNVDPDSEPGKVIRSSNVKGPPRIE